jgi:DNA-binding MarR family transcriptional regulator
MDRSAEDLFDGRTGRGACCGREGRAPGRLGEAPAAATEGATLTQPTRQDFENLLAFRVALRRFQRWSEDRASVVGLTHVQHQLLVAIKGHPDDRPPSIGQLAEYLLLQRHSAVGLVDRAEAAGFVCRRPDPDDARVVRVALTSEGDRLVTELATATLAEMRKLAIALNNVLLQHEDRPD